MENNKKNKYTEQEIRETSENFFNMILGTKKERKVKLEIDEPKACGECYFGHYDTYEPISWCSLVDYYEKTNKIDEYLTEGKPEWCPLCKEKLFDLIIHYGTPKSEFCVIDQKGVNFRVRNFLYENKIFFVVQANGKIADIIEITQGQPSEF